MPYLMPKKQGRNCPYSYSLIRSKHFTKILVSTNYATTIFSTVPIAADTSTHWVPFFLGVGGGNYTNACNPRTLSFNHSMFSCNSSTLAIL